MSKFRKKPVVVEAEQWHLVEGTSAEGYRLSVGYFRHPTVPSEYKCSNCDHIMHDHGWIDVPVNGITVCPGDWIITNDKGEKYPCKPDIFEATYEAVGEQHLSDCL